MTRTQEIGPEDNAPGATYACWWEVWWVREQATRLGLELDAEEVAPQDAGDLHALRASLLTALAACWPEFSAAEVRRLSFLAYRRTTGRLRPPAPLGAAGTQLAEEIAAYLHTPLPPAPQQGHATVVGVPPLWRAWLDAQRPPRRAQSRWDAFE